MCVCMCIQSDPTDECKLKFSDFEHEAMQNICEILRCKVGIITDNQIISSKSWWTHVYKIWYRKWYGKVDTCSKLHKTKSLNQSEHSMWHHLLQTNSNSIGNTVPRTSWQQTKVCLTHCPSICRTWLNKRNDKAEVRPSSSSKLVLMLHCLTSHCFQFIIFHLTEDTALCDRLTVWLMIVPNPVICVTVMSVSCPNRLTFTWWGCCGFCLWHKPTELARSFLLCSCVCFCLYVPFNCISFHKVSW